MELQPNDLVALAGRALLAAGSVLVLVSLRHQDRCNRLRPSVDPRAWKPVWLHRDRFASDAAFSRYVLGVALVAAGALIEVTRFLVR